MRDQLKRIGGLFLITIAGYFDGGSQAMEDEASKLEARVTRRRMASSLVRHRGYQMLEMKDPAEGVSEVEEESPQETH